MASYKTTFNNKLMISNIFRISLSFFYLYITDALKENMENADVGPDESKSPTEENEFQDECSDSDEEHIAGEMEAEKIDEENDSEIEAPQSTVPEEEMKRNDQVEDLPENQHNNGLNKSNEKPRIEEKVQSQPHSENNCSNDIAGDNNDDSKLEEPIDEQDCGEEKDGIGHAENEVSVSIISLYVKS